MKITYSTIKSNPIPGSARTIIHTAVNNGQEIKIERSKEFGVITRGWSLRIDGNYISTFLGSLKIAKDTAAELTAPAAPQLAERDSATLARRTKFIVEDSREILEELLVNAPDKAVKAFYKGSEELLKTLLANTPDNVLEAFLKETAEKDGAADRDEYEVEAYNGTFKVVITHGQTATQSYASQDERDAIADEWVTMVESVPLGVAKAWITKESKKPGWLSEVFYIVGYKGSYNIESAYKKNGVRIGS